MNVIEIGIGLKIAIAIAISITADSVLHFDQIQNDFQNQIHNVVL